jgi:aminopeptidase N
VAKKTFRFRNVAQRPVLSLNRGFSAPIRIKSETRIADQLFLMKTDNDTFNRWEAAQTAAHALLQADLEGRNPSADRTSFIAALRAVLEDPAIDQTFKSAMLTLPTEQEIATLIAHNVDPGAIHEAREALRCDIGKGLADLLVDLWDKTEGKVAYRPSPEETGRRSLRYAVLYALAGGDPALGTRLAMKQLAEPPSMTDEIGALSTLITLDVAERDQALDAFYARHKSDHLIIDKWFALQASAPLKGAIRRVRELMTHPDFKLASPNRVRSLIGTFAMGNPFAFHAEDGEGYAIVADTILALDPLNPQVAARMATAFRSWAGLEENRRGLVKAQLERMLATPRLSRDLFEIASKSLAISA